MAQSNIRTFTSAKDSFTIWQTHTKRKVYQMTKHRIIFEEGCFDGLDDFSQDDLNDLVAELESKLESGELFEESISVDDLPEEEQEEIYNMLNERKNTRQ